jgi:ATP-dependent Clp protease ATP-binding subunit ClpX
MANCSFCGKRPDEVFRIITSDGCRICNECVGRCAEMVASEYMQIAREVKFPPDESGEGS